MVTLRCTVVLYADNVPEELMDAYELPEVINQVGDTDFVDPSLIVAVQEYVALPPEFTLELPEIEIEETVRLTVVTSFFHPNRIVPCLEPYPETAMRYVVP